MKRIRVPEGMLNAAYEVSRVQRRDTTLEEILEAALLWASEHPQVPTDEQMKEVVAATIERAKEEGARGTGVLACAEWQRRCFVQEEPETPAEIENLSWGKWQQDRGIPPVINGWLPIETHNQQIIEAFRRGLRKGEQK